MLNDDDKRVILDSWRLVVPIKETAADLSYRRLFELRPDYRDLFPGDLAAQKRKLVTMLAFVVRSLDWREEAWREEVPEHDDLFLVVLALGRRHSQLYRVPDEAYGVVGEALLWTLDQGLGQAFTERTRTAWVRVYEAVSQTMMLGSAALDLGTPAPASEWSEA